MSESSAASPAWRPGPSACAVGASRSRASPELKGFLDQLGINVVQIACGDPHHASWDEGDALPAAARASGIVMTGAMLGFPGEDYTTPQTIKETGGFGNPATRAERIERLKWALDRTLALGLKRPHAPRRIPARARTTPTGKAMLDTLAQAGQLAADKGVTLAFETGQETAELLRLTLDDLKSPNLKVNFDPANMILYDMGDPIRAVEILGPDIRSVHLKDGRRPPSPGSGERKCRWVKGRSDIPRFLQALKSVGYTRAPGDRARSRRPGRPTAGCSRGAGAGPRMAGPLIPGPRT